MKSLATIILILLNVLLAGQNLAIGQMAEDGIQQFNVGVIIPLTGDLAEYGVAIKNGFELAASEAPEKFSHIHFIYEDSKYDGKTAVSALQKLRTSNSIDLYYLWGVSPTEATLPVAAAQKLAVIAETTVKNAVVGKPLVIRAARTGERIAKALTAELAKQSIKSVSFIVAEIPFYLDILKYMEVSLKEHGISLRQKKEILPSEMDFRSHLLDKTSHQNEAQGVFLLPSQFPIFFKQASELNFPLRAFNAEVIDSESIVESCPDNVNGTFFTQVGVTPEFRQIYREKFKDEIHVGSGAQSYDVAQIIGNLFGNLKKKLNAEEIIQKISELSEHKGVTGTFKYSESADAGKELRMPVAMRVVKDKKILTITEDTGF